MEFFEGIEKKFELCADPAQHNFLEFATPFWEKLVERSRAKILSSIENKRLKAFLLSESSLFVMQDRVIMITCGTTTLAGALSHLISKIGKESVRMCFFERKNHVFPEYQRYHFFEDYKFIKQQIPCKAFRFGKEDEHHLYLLQLKSQFCPAETDQTLEILMHGISDDSRAIFEAGDHRSRQSIYEKTGIHEVIPGFTIDDHLFEPAGYSLNAIHREEYFTLHVTPQKIGSYVSFETNHPFESTKEMEEVIQRVLRIFNPDSFDLIYFRNHHKAELPEIDKPLKTSVDQDMDCGFKVSFKTYYQGQPGTQHATELFLED